MFVLKVEYFASPKYQSVDSVFAGEGKVSAPYGGFCMETGVSDGGWIATPPDLVKLFQSLEGQGGERIIKPETFKVMLQPPSYAKGAAWYGLGLDVSWYRKAWEHSGTLDGATCSLVRDRHGYTWAFLCNYWPPDTDFTSLIMFAMSHVKSWTKVMFFTIPRADIASLDTSFVIKVKLPHESFEDLNNYFLENVYNCTWINSYQVSGKTFTNAIWTKEVNTVTELAISVDDIEQKCHEHVVEGYFVKHIDAYFINDILNFSIIFKKALDNSTNICHKLLTDVKMEDLPEILKTMETDSYQLKHISPYNSKYNSVSAAVLFEQVPKEELTRYWFKTNLDSEAYQVEFDRQARYGHLLSFVKTYAINNCVKFCAIWITNPGPYVYISEHGMSKYRFLNDMQFAAQKKCIPICVSGYEEEGAHKFVAVSWKKVTKKRPKLN